jgi:hypothetical protein
MTHLLLDVSVKLLRAWHTQELRLLNAYRLREKVGAACAWLTSAILTVCIACLDAGLTNF